MAWLHGRRVGLALIDMASHEYEIVAIHTTEHRRGIGRDLMSACFLEAQAHGYRRVWLVTTNNNIAAIAFYQQVGMDTRVLHYNAVQTLARAQTVHPLRSPGPVQSRGSGVA